MFYKVGTILSEEDASWLSITADIYPVTNALICYDVPRLKMPWWCKGPPGAVFYGGWPKMVALTGV